MVFRWRIHRLNATDVERRSCADPFQFWNYFIMTSQLISWNNNYGIVCAVCQPVDGVANEGDHLERRWCTCHSILFKNWEIAKQAKIKSHTWAILARRSFIAKMLERAVRNLNHTTIPARVFRPIIAIKWNVVFRLFVCLLVSFAQCARHDHKRTCAWNALEVLFALNRFFASFVSLQSAFHSIGENHNYFWNILLLRCCPLLAPLDAILPVQLIGGAVIAYCASASKFTNEKSILIQAASDAQSLTLII